MLTLIAYIRYRAHDGFNQHQSDQLSAILVIVTDLLAFFTATCAHLPKSPLKRESYGTADVVVSGFLFEGRGRLLVRLHDSSIEGVVQT